MKKVLLALSLTIALVACATGAFAQTAAQGVTGFLLAQGSTYGSFTCPSTATSPCYVQYGASIPVTATITPSGTQDVNVKQIGATTVLAGSGATGTGSERVTVAVDSATVAGSASLPAGTNTIGNVTLQPSATIGLTTSNCTAACASTLVSGAHTLYGGSFSATVTGWLLIYDAVACSANGTVQPKKAIAYTTANSSVGFSWSDTPIVNATGISACFSSTGPYTATASTTAFISVDYK